LAKITFMSPVETSLHNERVQSAKRRDIVCVQYIWCGASIQHFTEPCSSGFQVQVEVVVCVHEFHSVLYSSDLI